MKPIFKGKINEKGKLEIENKDDFDLWIGNMVGKEVEITVSKKIKKRTSKQNRALHLWFTLLANAMNEAGYDMKKVIRDELDISWTDYNVKEYLFRPLMKNLFGYKSSNELKTGDIDKIYDIINKTISERTGVHVPFPSLESQFENKNKK